MCVCVCVLWLSAGVCSALVMLYTSIYNVIYSAGEEYLVEALKHCEEVLGEDHDQTVVSLRNLSNLYKQTNRFGDVVTGVAACDMGCFYRSFFSCSPRMEWATSLLEQACGILAKVI